MSFFLSFIFFSLCSFAQNNSPLKTYHLIRPDTNTMDAVAKEFEVVKKLTNGYEVYVPEVKLKRFLLLAPKAKLIPSNKFKNYSLAGYRNMKSVEKELKKLVIQFPELAKLESYGKTKSGHPLYVLKVSDNVQVDEDETELMITSATHGDEIITVEVEMELIQLLLQSYGKDPRLTKMLQEKEIFFIPVVNPQGYSNHERYANNVDPNRDYPYPEDKSKKSVDCIDSLRKWFHGRNIKGSIDLHAYGQLIMFPWAYTMDSPPRKDEVIFQDLTRSMAEINNYEFGQISEVIYIAKGSSADYYYWKKKTVALAVELSTSKAPPFGAVSKVVKESQEMVWRFIEYFR